MKIPGRSGKLPGTYQVDADLAPSAEQCHWDGVDCPRLDHAAADGSLGTMVYIAR